MMIAQLTETQHSTLFARRWENDTPRKVMRTNVTSAKADKTETKRAAMEQSEQPKE